MDVQVTTQWMSKDSMDVQGLNGCPSQFDQLFSKGDFKLTNFISNVPGLLEELEDQSVEAVPKVIGASMEESASHVLGLK